MKKISPIEPKQTITIDRSIRFNDNLTFGEKLFLAEIQSLCSEGPCQYHRSELSNIFGVSEPSIYNWMKKLCSLGYVEIFKGDRDPIGKWFMRLKKVQEKMPIKSK